MAQPNHQHEENWSAAGMVGMFDAVHRERDRKRYRRNLLLWALTITICLGVPLWVTWGKYQDARRMTLLEEFASKRPAAEQLTLTNPAVASALEGADKLREAATSQSPAESIAKLRQTLDLLTTAHNADRDTKRIRELLDPVGQTLLETPWHITSKKIDSEQKRLGQQHKVIVTFLDLSSRVGLSLAPQRGRPGTQRCSATQSPDRWTQAATVETRCSPRTALRETVPLGQ